MSAQKLRLVFLVIISSSSVVLPQGWTWSWTCIDGKCVRSDENSEGPTDPSKTLQLCSLTCGHYGALWPQPTGSTFISSAVVPFHPSRMAFNLVNVAGRRVGKRNSDSQRFLAQTAQYLFDDLMSKCGSNCSNEFDTEALVRVSTASHDTSLHSQTDESYVLQISTKGNKVGVQINAKTIYGARHALETLNQLTAGYYGADSKYHMVIVAAASITDKPAYGHRGLMLDTSRHFIPVNLIKRSMDAMAMSKMNVLHWHATDSHSFPLSLPSIPQLARFGAYSAKETYSKADMIDLIEYGRQNGIRVIMEIDAPAHASSGWQWGSSNGLGDLAVCINKQPWRKFCVQPPCGQLNPVNPNTYRMLRTLYRDLISIFPRGEIFHMGGDEVAFSCWNSSVEIRHWMEKNGRSKEKSDYLWLWTEFQNHVLRIYDEEANNTKTPIVLWTSDLTSPDTITLDPERYIIETWTEKRSDTPQKLIAKGYKIIVATKDVWYLDHGFYGITKYHDWKTMYNYQLPSTSRNILGGETAMWSELVDESNMEPRIWPRAAAVAERLWSNPSTDSRVAESRFLQHRERLVQRGLHVDAVIPQWCYQHDQECS